MLVPNRDTRIPAFAFITRCVEWNVARMNTAVAGFHHCDPRIGKFCTTALSEGWQHAGLTLRYFSVAFCQISAQQIVAETSWNQVGGQWHRRQQLHLQSGWSPDSGTGAGESAAVVRNGP